VRKANRYIVSRHDDHIAMDHIERFVRSRRDAEGLEWFLVNDFE
jgi:hypothetical protein